MTLLNLSQKLQAIPSGIRVVAGGRKSSVKERKLSGQRGQSARRQAVPPGVAERRITVRGHSMRYLSAGSGPALLLIHGLMGYSFSWSENLIELAKHFTVYAPDLFNSGWSDRVEQDGRLRTAAASIVAFMDAMGIERAHLVGSSHGGTLVMVAAAMWPERFDKVMAVSPANSISEKARWQARVFSTWWGRIAGHCVPYLAPVIHGYFLSRMYADRSRILLRKH